MTADLSVVFDVETYAGAVGIEVGHHRYATDPQTDVLCVAWVAMDALGRVLHDTLSSWTPGDPVPSWAAGNGDAWAWNVAFDRTIYDAILVPRYGWPARDPDRFRCLMVRAAYGNLPMSLAKAGAVLGAAERKSAQGHRLMLRLSKPAPPLKRETTPNPRRHHTPEALSALVDYCRQDVLAEADLVKYLPTLPPQEERAYRLDRTINDRGILVDTGLVDACIAAADAHAADLTARLQDLTDGAVQAATRLDDLAEWLRGQGVDVPRGKGAMDKAAVAGYIADARDPLSGYRDPDRIVAVLSLRQALGKSSLRRFPTLRDAADPIDHRLRGSLEFYGAHQTGRWAGRIVQPHSLPRGVLGKAHGYDIARDAVRTHHNDVRFLHALYGDGLDPAPDAPGLPAVLSSLMRACFIAPPGKTLAVVDWSAIEARGVFWLADDPVGLRAFQDGRDVYRLAAAPIIGVPSADDVSQEDRNALGKPTVLGCGYGMGPARFAETFGAAMDVAERAVRAYRTTFARVPALWRSLERAAIRAIKNPGDAIPVARGRVLFKHTGRHLWCRLPSGRALCYRDATLIPGRFPDTLAVEFASEDQTHQWSRGTIWGGTFLENIVQAFCSDLLRHTLGVLEQEPGLDVVLHVHDEGVVEADDPGTPIARRALLAGVERLFCRTPAWASGFPIAAEGMLTPFWRK